jgi:exopolysaccharide production protein ExoQ
VPPQLALVGCIGFVLFLLRLEHRHYSGVSPAVWLSTIWLISVSSRPLGYYFGNPNMDMESGGSPLDRGLLILILTLSLVVLARRGSDWAMRLKENPWLVALIVFMLVSTLWSPQQSISFRRWISDTLVIIAGLLVATEKNPRMAIQCALRRTIYILIPFSWLLIKYFPQYGIEYQRQRGSIMWLGVASQKNGLAKLATLACFFLIWSLVRRWRKESIKDSRFLALMDIFIVILSLRLIKGADTYSATSITMLALGLLLYIWLMIWGKRQQQLRGKVLTAVVMLIIVYGTSSPFVGKLPVGDISSALGRESTLTGRSAIWATLVPLAMSKPVLGHGWNGFWTRAARESFYFFPAHNGYLETLLAIGFIGLFLIVIFIMSSCRKAVRELNVDYEWGVLWCCWLVMILAHNITESSLPNLANLSIATIVWFTIGAKQESVVT